MNLKTLKTLMGSGDKVMIVAAPTLVVGLVLNYLYPPVFSVGGPPVWLRLLSAVMLILGLINWVWSVILILIKVPKKELITSGPYAIIKHPIYTGFAFLILPWLGFLLNNWLGLAVGIAMYVGTRRYAPEEEKQLAKTFGPVWDRYCKKVILPWL